MNKLFHIFFLSLGGLSSAIADLKRPKAPLRCWQLANPALFGSADAFRNHRVCQVFEYYICDITNWAARTAVLNATHEIQTALVCSALSRTRSCRSSRGTSASSMQGRYDRQSPIRDGIDKPATVVLI